MSTQEALYEELTNLCRRLRLKYVREELREVAITARAQRWDPAERLRVLLEAEAKGRARDYSEQSCAGPEPSCPPGRPSRAGRSQRTRCRGPLSTPCAAWPG